MTEKHHSSSWLSHPTTALVARVILACVFIVASLDKIKHPDSFAEAVFNYQLLPDVAVNLVAIWLPWLELVGGVLLLLGIWVRGSIVVLSGLMVVFLGALGVNLARGLDIHCGCFISDSADPITVLTLFRDGFFLLLGLYLFWLYQIRRVEAKFSLVRIFKRDIVEN
ncbi:MAG: DoxX family membrane protein [Deltaproteobacteria bacterium]|nr:MAG: DoxX family membrane protein [Deltaproteobacteria bacterium]